jgi:hypothetical protein
MPKVAILFAKTIYQLPFGNGDALDETYHGRCRDATKIFMRRRSQREERGDLNGGG